MGNTLTVFQIWTRERNPTVNNKIAGKIEKAIPSYKSTKLPIWSNLIYEFLNMQSGLWEQFDIENTMIVFNWHIAQGFPPESFQWRKTGGKITGNLIINRADNFIQPRPNDEIDIKIYYGTIETKSHIFS